MAKHVFLERGKIYSLVEGNFDVSNAIKPGVYNMIFSQDQGIQLEWLSEKFFFDFKLYGIDETLVGHVIDTYKKQSSKHNIGILLNGAKGTGKTVTAKELCNRLDLPVIIVSAPFPGLSNFISHVNQDCVFFFDEFEKNFRTTGTTNDKSNNAGENLLSIMDGVYSGGNTHIFILTTNELMVNDNILSRPSRIRYLKCFGSVIDKKVVNAYVDDNLLYPERKEEIMSLIDRLTLSTIDIVKSIVEEVNIHNCSVEEFKHFFNIKTSTYNYYGAYCTFDARGVKLSFNEVKMYLNGRGSEKMKNYFGTYPNRFHTYLEKKCCDLKPGDHFSGGYHVIKIYNNGEYVLCNYGDNKDDICIYKIDNPMTTPSLYGDKHENQEAFYRSAMAQLGEDFESDVPYESFEMVDGNEKKVTLSSFTSSVPKFLTIDASDEGEDGLF